MQVVFLSARPQVLRGTLAHWRAHAPWVDRVLVVTPSPLAGLECVLDRDLLGGAGPADHSTRNYALRAALARCDAVDDVFLAADDDNR
ncbi:MAG: glycosyltransferase family 1 protein, partial [Frankiales bacterium]|nr:glycosyltransferase family 1 protein [Frankiales bacterium]